MSSLIKAINRFVNKGICVLLFYVFNGCLISKGMFVLFDVFNKCLV